MLILIRRFYYRIGIKKVSRFSAPIIVIGNVTVGGTGKTPLVIWMANWLQSRGCKPGIVARGYRGKATHWPQVVFSDTDPYLVGDEAVLLAQRTHCPVVVGPKRVHAVKKLLADYSCDIVLSDDGLQHHAMGRDIEIVAIDGQRRFGNRLCLPAGPLRESLARLRSVDCIVTNGEAKPNEYAMHFLYGKIYNIQYPEQSIDLHTLKQNTVHAVAGIGNPQRFFQQLREQGLDIVPHEFPDHYFYKKSDFDFGDDKPILMTEKDAVKCRAFADHRYWCLRVEVTIEDCFEKAVGRLLLARKYNIDGCTRIDLPKKKFFNER